MTQLLTLSSVNVASNSNTDKAATSAVNNKDNAVFVSELERRENETPQSINDRVTKADSEAGSKQAVQTDKAEDTESKDGKKLPPEKAGKKIEAPGAEANEVDSELVSKTAEEAKPLASVSITPLVEVVDERKVTTRLMSESKQGSQATVMVGVEKPNSSEKVVTSIRADIFHALQKQSGEGEAGATEKIKSMTQHATKMPQQMNTTSAEVVASMRQLEPLIERGSAPTVGNPLVFSTTAGVTTPVVGGANIGAPALSLDIQPQLNQAAWTRVMSSRVVWMAREGAQHAELRLNPAHLGSVEVRLSMQNEQTSVSFIASNAAAREALEQALPRLRESFSDNGLALNHAEVSHQEQSPQGSEQDERLQEGNNIAQVIIETDDIEGEVAQVSADSIGSSVSVFA